MTGLLKATNKKTKSTNPKLTQDDIVYGHIFDAILEQRLPPGTKLSEEAGRNLWRQPHHHSSRPAATFHRTGCQHTPKPWLDCGVPFR